MSCETRISKDILFECSDMPIAGLSGSRAVLINFEDINKAQSTEDGAIITQLTLNEGSTGYRVEWYKKLGHVESEFSKSDDQIDGFRHSFLSRLATSSAYNAERADELTQGNFVMVVETKFKGDEGKDAFKVYGWGSGMYLEEMTGSSAENGGSLLYTLQTDEEELEKYPYRVLLMDDYESTKAAFDSLFEEEEE